MKKLVLLPTLLLIGCLLFSFITPNSIKVNLSDNEIGYLPANCEQPVYFQIDSQEPCNLLKVNPESGELSLLRKRKGICGNFDGASRVQVNYSVTNADGLRHGNFIIIDLEEEE